MAFARLRQRAVQIHLHALDPVDRGNILFVMALSTISVSPDDSILDAARLMSEARIRHLPVRQGERVVGMLSIRDVLDVLLTGTAVA